MTTTLQTSDMIQLIEIKCYVHSKQAVIRSPSSIMVAHTPDSVLYTLHWNPRTLYWNPRTR